ncbi:MULTISPECIES: PaaI family thioesterase [unclassified Phenylobacterium]|uniref:PaaI family thioesterase n=1 Tax=unclassified Phenylobacterium TaxID=2640670 RepID=UPI000839F32F|nr:MULTISPECIES: PaaI family thioesterase [unclassified Phenylobacterium]
MEGSIDIPAGFERHDRSAPATRPWEPIWRRHSGDTVILGLRVRDDHCNSRGFVHGGLISSIADAAMGLSCARRLGDLASLVTVNLTVDFLGSALVGQWLEFDTVFVNPGRTLCFTQAFVTADGQPCARANAVFRVVRKQVAA